MLMLQTRFGDEPRRDFDLTPASWSPAAGLPIAPFHKDDAIVEEGAVMIRGGGFTVSTFGAGTDLTAAPACRRR